MLKGLLMVKGIVALATFITASIAYLTMMQLRKKIPPLFRADTATLRRWHLASGRLSLVFFIFLAFIGMSLAFYLYPPSSIRPWLHVIVSILTTVVFVGKVIIIRRKIRPGLQRILPIGILLMILHLAIFLTATIWAYWFKITGAL